MILGVCDTVIKWEVSNSTISYFLFEGKISGPFVTADIRSFWAGNVLVTIFLKEGMVQVCQSPIFL